jgi:hypothetical protein
MYLNTLTTPPSSLFEGAIIDLVDDLNTSGVWDLKTCIWILCEGTSFGTALNLRYPFASKNANQLLHIGSPTFASDGIQYDTTTNQSYTSYNPNNLGNGNYHFSIYSQTDSQIVAAITDMGMAGAFTTIFLRDNNSNRAGYQLNGTTNATGTVARSDGYYLANASGTNGKLVKDGSTVVASGTISNNNTNGGLFINGRENSLRAGRKYSLASTGAALTDTQITDEYTAIQTFHTTLGIQK